MKVIPTVLTRNAPTPVNTDSLSRARRTFTLTFPHRIVQRRKLESFLSRKIRRASLLPISASASRRSQPTVKNARLRPENIAEWARQTRIATQTSDSDGRLASTEFGNTENRLSSHGALRDTMKFTRRKTQHQFLKLGTFQTGYALHAEPLRN